MFWSNDGSWLLACHAIPWASGGFCLTLIGPPRQGVCRTANASVQELGQVIVVSSWPPSSTRFSRPLATESSGRCLRRTDNTEVESRGPRTPSHPGPASGGLVSLADPGATAGPAAGLSGATRRRPGRRPRPGGTRRATLGGLSGCWARCAKIGRDRNSTRSGDRAVPGRYLLGDNPHCGPLFDGVASSFVGASGREAERRHASATRSSPVSLTEMIPCAIVPGDGGLEQRGTETTADAALVASVRRGLAAGRPVTTPRGPARSLAAELRGTGSYTGPVPPPRDAGPGR